MALYAFDGTWNEDEDAPQQDTNVVRFRDLYEGPVEYRAGVSTRFGAIGRALGGVFGMGGRSRIEEMYDALAENWKQGDRIVDIIGFSRGAALAVHFANVVARAGVRLPDGGVERPPIRFLGLWDIVGSFGIPIDFIIDFHDINLGWTIDQVPESVAHCAHAMALDERRQTFDLTRLDAGGRPTVEEVWFRGVHSDVGGGNGNVARNAIALQWMLEQGRRCGLPISQGAIQLVAAAADPLAPISRNFDPIPNPSRDVAPEDRFHPTAVSRPLEVGEAASFPVRAADKSNWSGVRLEQGATYQFDIPGGQKWMDAGIACGPEGWRSEDLPWYKEPLVKWFEDKRRCPEANWFELIGCLDDDDRRLFRIGRGGPERRYVAPETADLWAFANDLDWKYDNNEGKLLVTVTRTA
ncbi:MAG: hypothetical protein Kow0092_28730 [Deferrisomatales bacterium]